MPEDLILTRIFDAPRELVFKAWTDPDQLLRWYAPNGCTIHFNKLDLRPGGAFHSCIHTPDGYDCWCTGTYREIIAPERIVFTMGTADDQGHAIDSATAGHDPEWPAQTTVTVTLDKYEGNKTKLTLHQTVSEALATRTGAHSGWLQMLDRLAGELAEPDRARLLS